MFGFREIRTREKVTDRFEDGYKRINPDKRITDEECNAFWEEEFRKNRDLMQRSIEFTESLDARV